jgi:Dehydrogenase E1 component
MEPSNDLLVEIYRRILRIRFFEEAVLDLKNKAESPGAAHLCIGHEAVMVGACMAAGERSFMTGGHRSHGHHIAKGADIQPLMAELMARSSSQRMTSTLSAPYLLSSSPPPRTIHSVHWELNPDGANFAIPISFVRTSLDTSFSVKCRIVRRYLRKCTQCSGSSISSGCTGGHSFADISRREKLPFGHTVTQ